MKTAKCFDIHDKDITPEIYILLFCGAFVELTGNDTWYKIDPFPNEDSDDGWVSYDSSAYTKSSQQQFSEYLNRGYRNCFHNSEKMKEFYFNPCSCEEAIVRFKSFLTSKGVTKDDILFVKIWW